MDSIYQAIVVNKQKALVAFVFGILATYFAKHGIDLDTITVKEFFEQIASGLIGYFAVYAKANKPE